MLRTAFILGAVLRDIVGLTYFKIRQATNNTESRSENEEKIEAVVHTGKFWDHQRISDGLIKLRIWVQEELRVLLVEEGRHEFDKWFPNRGDIVKCEITPHPEEGVGVLSRIVILRKNGLVWRH